MTDPQLQILLKKYEQRLDAALEETRTTLLAAHPELETKKGFRSVPYVEALVPLEKVSNELAQDIKTLSWDEPSS